MTPGRMRVFAVAVLVAGCGGATSAELADVEEADDSVSSASVESALAAALTETSGAPASDVALAEAQAQAVPQEFTTPACVEKVQQGTRVTFSLSGCTGSYGLVSVTGTVEVVYKVVLGGIQATVTGTDITVNGATVNLDVVATRTTVGGVTTLSVTTETSGVGRRGNGASRSGEYAVTIDPAAECLTINGTWQTRVGLKSATTAVAGYAQCKGRCPLASGTVTQTYSGGAVASLRFDGSASAAWTYTSGAVSRSGTLTLMCQP